LGRKVRDLHFFRFGDISIPVPALIAKCSKYFTGQWTGASINKTINKQGTKTATDLTEHEAMKQNTQHWTEAVLDDSLLI